MLDGTEWVEMVCEGCFKYILIYFNMDIGSNYTALCFAKALLAKHVLASKKKAKTLRDVDEDCQQS